MVGTIKNKDRKRSAECFQINCARGVVPKKLCTDSGAEFKFKGLDDFLKSNNVYHDISLNTAVKANYSERVILTLKRYVQGLVEDENNTLLSSKAGMNALIVG